jgi:hypothetical protein
MILSAHTEKNILLALPAESMILSAPPERQWAMTTVQWAAGRQSNRDGRRDSGGTMGGTMGSRSLPPMQKRTIGGDTRWSAAAITMDGGGMTTMDSSSSNEQ